MRHAATILRRALTVVGVLCLGLWTAVKVYAYASTAHNKSLLERLVRERRGDLAIPAIGAKSFAERGPSAGSLLGWIDIPRLGTSAAILEGTDERWLEQGAGHLPDTALPAADGNAAIAGHRDSVFRGLRRVVIGDRIEVTTPTSTHVYAVDSLKVVPPTDTSVIAPSPTEQLTLITCYPFTYIGPAPERFVVQAHRVADEGAGRSAHLARLASSMPAPVGSAVAATNRPATEPPPAVRRARSPHRTTAKPAVAPAPIPPLEPVPRKVSWLKRLFHIGAKRTPIPVSR
jgi:LPXTG-site transpeptidase (sortase) family protein